MNFVVLGASRGLGYSLTQTLLMHNHRVVASVRAVDETLDDLKGRYPESLHITIADITDEAAMEACAVVASDYLGAIDAVCVSAGIIADSDRDHLLHESMIEDVRRTFDVNVIGPIIAAKVFTPRMKDGGSIFVATSEGVHLSSVGSWIPAYGLSKTAATKVCGVLNASVPQVNYYAVHPGRMNTDMGRTTAQIEPEESAEGFRQLMDGSLPTHRNNWYIDYMGNVLEL